MNGRTNVKLVALTDSDGEMLARISMRLDHLSRAVGANGAAAEAEFLGRLSRKVSRALTIHDYYDKYASDD